VLGGLNTYLYVGGNPVQRRDPSGLIGDPLGELVDANPMPYVFDPMAPREKGPVSMTCYVLCATSKIGVEITGFGAVEAIGSGVAGIWGANSATGKIGAAAAGTARVAHKVVTPIGAISALDSCLADCEEDPSCPAWNAPANPNFPRIPAMSMDPYIRRR
jgi:hypothetical protein